MRPNSVDVGQFSWERGVCSLTWPGQDGFFTRSRHLVRLDADLTRQPSDIFRPKKQER